MTSSEPQIQTQSEIMFFLGAGASVPAGLKDVTSVIPDFQEWITKPENKCQDCSEAVNQIVLIMSNWYASNPNSKSVNIETLLEIVERLEGSFTDMLPDFFKDKTLKLDEVSTGLLKNGRLSSTIKAFIQITFQEFKTSKY